MTSVATKAGRQSAIRRARSQKQMQGVVAIARCFVSAPATVLSATDIEQQLGTTPRVTKYNLKKLMDMGLVVQNGTGRKTTYRMLPGLTDLLRAFTTLRSLVDTSRPLLESPSELADQQRWAIYRLCSEGLSDRQVAKLTGVGTSWVQIAVRRRRYEYGGIVATAPQVTLLREALLWEIGDPLDTAAAIAIGGNKLDKTEDTLHALRELDAFRLLLGTIGWTQPAIPYPVEIDLALHQWALTNGVKHKLDSEREYAASEDPQEAAKGQANVDIIEGLLASVQGSGKRR